MKILGIEFAPLNVPLERRLQTLGILHHIWLFLIFGFGMVFLFFYLLVFTDYYLIPLAYFAWYLYDRRVSQQGGRRSDWVRRWALFRWGAAYFPLQLIKTQEIDPSKNYIFACHPHGVMSYSHFLNFSSEGSGFGVKFPGIKPFFCVMSVQFMFPVFREYFMLTGAVEVSQTSIEWVLTKEGTGNAVCIVVGGAHEALDAHPGNFTLKIKSRKGFCKLALKHGAGIVPVFAFGENNLYGQIPNPHGSVVRKLQNYYMRIFGFPISFYHGRGIFNYTFGLLPFRKPIHTVVGAPLDVKKVPEPTEDQVNDLHDQYCKALVELFEKHKTQYGCKESDHLNLL